MKLLGSLMRNIFGNFYALFVVMVLGISTYLLVFPSFTAEVRYISVPEGRIAYYVRGEGKPLILIEGFGMSMQDWDPSLVRSLAKRYQLIVYDVRGVGFSTGAGENLSTTVLVDDVIALQDALGLKTSYIMGWSMGSLVAQEIATSHPERVERLILVSTFSNDKNTIHIGDELSRSIQDNLGNSWEDLFVPLLFTPDAKGTSLQTNYLKRRHSAIRRGEAPRTGEVRLQTKIVQEQAIARMGADGSRLSRIGEITMPTLILTGESDRLVLTENSSVVANAIPNSTLIRIPGAGHGVLFQNSSHVLKSITNFLPVDEL